MIPLSVPNLKGNELKYVSECINTEWVSSEGSFVDSFAEKVKEYTGAQYAIPCVNGTSALQTSLRMLNLFQNDEVILPSLTFIAPVNAVRYFNANPIFFDCDKYFNINIDQIDNFLKKNTKTIKGELVNKITGNKIKAIIPVNIFGNALDIESLLEVAEKYDLPVIEDASEAIGTKNYNNKHAGTDGLTGCLSFNGNKMITTGGGGMILTNDKEYAEKMSYLTRQAKDDKVFYIHNDVGYNFRMNNIAAAIGLAQIENLDKFLKIKKSNFLLYKKLIKDKENIELIDVPIEGNSNHWFYSLRIKQKYNKTLEDLIYHLHNNQIQARPIWKLNHQQLPYKNCYHEDLSNSIKYLKSIINIPCSTNLTEMEIEKVVYHL